MKNEINLLQEKLISLGYLDTEIPNTFYKNDTIYVAKIKLNTKYSVLQLLYDESIIDIPIIKTNLKTKSNHISLPLRGAKNFLNNLTKQFVNQGKAFTQLELTNIYKKKDTVVATLILRNDKVRMIDKYIIKGYKNFPRSFLRFYGGLKKRMIFNKEKIVSKSKILNTLPFASTIKPPESLFKKDSTHLYLYFKKIPANSFDGFLGFSNAPNSQRLGFNGNINLKLVNNLNYGEELNILYKNDGNEQQRFESSVTLPYLFKTPIGIELKLRIFRKDSSFLNTEQFANITYMIGDKKNLSLGYQVIDSNSLIDNNASNLILTDYKSTFLTTSFRYTKSLRTDIPFATHQEFALHLDVGKRKTQNTSIRQQKGISSLTYLIKLNKKNVIQTKNELGVLISDSYFSNELYRFGGINSIRGFEENAINASLYYLLNTEYRYLLANNLMAHTIIDYAYFEDKSINLTENLTSLGFGFGFKKQNSLYRILFANGKTSNQNFSFSNTKVHISIITNF